MRRLPKLHPLTELVERLRFVPETIFVSLSDPPTDGNVFDFDAGDRRSGRAVQLVERDGFSQLGFQLTRVNKGDGGQLGDDSLLPDTNVVEQLATAFDNCISDEWLLE
jgi:hypothetical protein